MRRQTAPKPGQPEVQVLDYQNCANTLLPLVAGAYALHFMGNSMMAMYRSFEKDREAGRFGLLPELHALSSGMKAVCTWITADGIEECRWGRGRACCAAACASAGWHCCNVS